MLSEISHSFSFLFLEILKVSILERNRTKVLKMADIPNHHPPQKCHKLMGKNLELATINEG
jgi:hypothetical protein